MHNKDHCPAPTDALYILLHHPFRIVIQCAGRFVKNEYPRVTNQSPCDGQALPARQRCSVSSPSGSARINSCAPAMLAASITTSAGAPGSLGAMFYLMQRLNSILSCSTTPDCRRNEDTSASAEPCHPPLPVPDPAYRALQQTRHDDFHGTRMPLHTDHFSGTNHQTNAMKYLSPPGR